MVYLIINSRGLSLYLETANFIPYNIRRPGYISVNNWSLGKTCDINVSICLPLRCKILYIVRYSVVTIASVAIDVSFAAAATMV